MPELSLEPLRRVLLRLREGLEVYRSDPDNTIFLDSLIKRFELAYEMSKNTLARYIEQNSIQVGAEEITTLAALIRTANQDGLLRSDWEKWRLFRDARNQTAHAYDEERARIIAAEIPSFLQEAEFLYKQMNQRLAKA